MTKMENLINESIKDRLVEVTSKPKRRRLKGGIIASTEEHRSNICKEIRFYEHQEQQERLVPVLFMWGKPHEILTKSKAEEYTALGMRIEYMKHKEAKNLIK
mgnify:CR=1 FL=1